MAEYITLEHFGAAQQHYHIYKIRKTDLDHQAHYHNYYQVCCVVSGEVIHCQNRGAVTLYAGDTFIVPPNFTHSLQFNNASTEMFSLAFEEALFAPGFPQSNAYKFLESLQSKATDPEQESVRMRVRLDKMQRKIIENLLDSLLQQQHTDCPPGLSCAPSLVAAVICLLAQGYYQQPHNSSELDELSSYNSTLLQCASYIDEHFREEMSLQFLSKKFGLSRSSFCSVFPQFTGMPLHKYVAYKRIKEAQALIRSCPDQTITQIATEVGYRDDSTFYRNFLRITGISPLKYKNSFRSIDDDHIDRVL